MTRYQKLFLAAVLFCAAAYGFIVGLQAIVQNTDLFTGRIIIIAVIAAVLVINLLILSAEGTTPYHLACRRQRENLVLRRALKSYARGLGDGGSFAREILQRIAPGGTRRRREQRKAMKAA